MKLSDLIDFEQKTYNWELIETIPEFSKLKEIKQNPKWHEEGNAFKHTKLVCEEAIKFCDELNYEESRMLLASALFHDIGKGLASQLGKDGNWHNYGHELVGESLARTMLWDFDDVNISFRESICSLIRYHMDPLKIFDSKSFYEKIIELSNVVPSWKLLVLLKKCDVNGSIQQDDVIKQSDLIKLSSLEIITIKMGCYKLPFKDYKESYKKYMEEKVKKHIDVAVMIGLPGSGKSTYANELARGNGDFNGGILISRDIIRYELGFCKENEKVVLSREQEDRVTEEFNNRLIKAAKLGLSVIIDNLNLKRRYRDAYKTALSNYNVTWHYFYVEAPSIEDNIKRRDGQISADVLRNMINGIEMPTPDEYDTIEYIKS